MPAWHHQAIWHHLAGTMGGMVDFWTLGCASENMLAMLCIALCFMLRMPWGVQCMSHAIGCATRITAYAGNVTHCTAICMLNASYCFMLHICWALGQARVAFAICYLDTDDNLLKKMATPWQRLSIVLCTSKLLTWNSGWRDAKKSNREEEEKFENNFQRRKRNLNSLSPVSRREREIINQPAILF